MESISSSHYLHLKLSGGLSAKKNPYDDVFGGQPPKKMKEGPDYKEIFGSSRASSIPILDLPPPPDNPNSNKQQQQQLLEYSIIFGADDNNNDDATTTTLSYPQLLSSNDAKFINNNTSSPHFRTPSAATGFSLQDPDHLSKDDKVFPPENSYQTFGDEKKFNMSYHKTSLGSKDGKNGTIHVAQFHHVPGFTCFVNETSPEKKEAVKLNPLPKNDIHGEVDFSKGMLDGKNGRKASKNVANKQTFGREVKSHSGFSCDGSYSDDRLFNAHYDLKSHSSKMKPPSSMASNLKHNDDHSKRWTAGSTEAPESDVSERGAGDYSPPSFGDELDENSAAAASAAILKNAILKAQESIRIAKELMERKGEGLRRSSTRNFKDRSRVMDRRENIIPHEGRTEDNNAKDTCGSADSISQVFSWMGKKSALRSRDVVSDFKDAERIIVAGKATVNAHAKNLLAAEKSEPTTWFSSMVNMRKNITAISSIDHTVRNFKSTQPIDDLECNVKEMNIITDEKALELEYMERKPITVTAVQESVENVDKLESGCVVHEHEEIGKVGYPRDDEENELKQTGFYRDEDCEKKGGPKSTIEDELNFEGLKLENDFEKRQDITQDLEENENEQEKDSRQEHIEKGGKDVGDELYELKQKRIHDEDVDEERFEDASHWEEDENELKKEAWGNERDEKSEKDIHKGEDTKSRVEDVRELKVDGKTSKDLHVGKEREELYEEFELEENENCVKNSYGSEEKMYIEIEANKIDVLQEGHNDDNYHKISNSWSNSASENISETQKCQCGIDSSREPNQALNDSLRIGAIDDFHGFEMGEAEALKFLHKMKEKESSRTASLVQGDAEYGETKKNMRVAFEVFPSEGSAPKFGSFDVGFGKTEFVEREKEIGSDANLDNHIEIQADGSIKAKYISGEHVTSNDEESGINCLKKFCREQQYTTIKEDLETALRFSVSKEEKTIQIDENIRTRENRGTNEENKFPETPTMYEKKTNIYEEIKTSDKEGNEENLVKFPGMEEETSKAMTEEKEETEYLRQMDEANKREREREKDKMAVERAIREARERAFAGARERAERAAVERATLEVRHRVMDEARGKHEKASIEAKLRSERAAVERATAEARERALQKALSQKATSRAHAESFFAERFSAPSRDNAIKKSLSSSDLQRPDESNNESSKRSEARLERDKRIMERAARALAEKNKRDLLAQKEQAEKNRISEALDTDIKRWASGKEGNLRALLSTLQYILGPSSGWQAIPLTDIITPSAVKKAYRKATLYVHPDKLQQRGASIQQKYICEKVFDLLKAAWNRFNSEER